MIVGQVYVIYRHSYSINQQLSLSNNAVPFQFYLRDILYVDTMHTEQYSNKGRTHVQKAVVSKVLSREWKDLRIRFALDIALCTIPATRLSNFNFMSIMTLRSRTQSTLANIWLHIPYALLEHPGLWRTLDTVQAKHLSMAICSCQVRLQLCSRLIPITSSFWGTLTL